MALVHNCRVKRYPDGSADIVAASAPFGGGDIFREPQRFDGNAPAFGFPAFCPEPEPEDAYAALERFAIQDDGADLLPEQARRLASLERAKRRARTAVRDLGLCNDFSFFVTLTLDPERVDRYDPRVVVRHLNHWLDNNVRRHGLKYVLVPEHHKDGAIHFHGFFNDALVTADSGTMSVPGRKRPVRVRSQAHRAALEAAGGHAVYNLPGWGWGFSTAIRLYGERAAAIAYTCKYISKAQEKIGGRWYYSGGELRRPDVEWCDVDFNAFLKLDGAQPFDIPALPRTRFAKVRADRTNVLQETCEQSQEACDHAGAGKGVKPLPEFLRSPQAARGDAEHDYRIPRPAPASAGIRGDRPGAGP